MIEDKCGNQYERDKVMQNFPKKFQIYVYLIK